MHRFADVDPNTNVRLMRPHPAALLMPPMSEDEFQALKEDIRQNGVMQPVVVYEGQLLDGRHRMRACDFLGQTPPAVEYCGSDPIGFVVSTNMVRRHLDASQKRDAIAALLKLDPTRSDRAIAAMVKASPTTVGTVRAELEATVQIGQSARRVGADGVERPATQPVRSTTEPEVPQPVTEPSAQPAESSTPSTAANDGPVQVAAPRRVAAAPSGRTDAASTPSSDDERLLAAAAKAVADTVADELERLPRRLHAAFRQRVADQLRLRVAA